MPVCQPSLSGSRTLNRSVNHVNAVVKCSRLMVVPEPPIRYFRRCVRPSQVAEDAVDRRFVDTKWILNSEGPAADDQFLTTHQHFFPKPGACPQPLARRARLLWHYLLHRHGLKVSANAGHRSRGDSVRRYGAHALEGSPPIAPVGLKTNECRGRRQVSQEALAPPDIEPYVTEYTDQYARDDFTPTLEADLRRPDEPVSEVDAR